MAISKEQVEAVSKLARLELFGEELDKFKDQLSEILKYIDQLQEVNTRGVDTTAQVTGLENSWRSDQVSDCPEDVREAALNQAPELVANLIKVMSVFK